MSVLPLRVTVLDTWDEVALALPGETPVAELKRRALERAGVRAPAEGYVVKFRGAELPEGEVTLAQAGLVPNGALIVLPRRRIPAR